MKNHLNFCHQTIAAMPNNFLQKKILLVFLLVCIAFTSFAQNRQVIRTLSYTPDISIKKTKFAITKHTDRNKTLTLWIEDSFSTLPFREETIKNVYDSVMAQLPENFKNHQIVIISNNRRIEEYIPNAYRENIAIDASRRFSPPSITPIVSHLSRPYSITNGLNNRHIALWNSHGWYYNVNIDKWEWQRGRLFGTVEDMLTTAIVLPYLLPMLENAGANVFIPRERDTQTNEVIIDNDDKNVHYTNNWETIKGGYKYLNIIKGKDNPFNLGTYMRTPCYPTITDSIVWQINVPESAWYYVSLAYKSLPNSTDKALYNIVHSGGKSSVAVNQQIGGGTWIYAGKYFFDKNQSHTITLYNKGASGTVVTADAIRVGGGMGNIERGVYPSVIQTKDNPPFISDYQTDEKPINYNRARFTEAARYYLQFAGIPDSLIINQKKDIVSDYHDDIFGRANWVNYLMGGSAMYPTYKGLGIPIDACIALHTDAGRLGGDSIVGTLGIAMTTDDKGIYPAKYTRISARDFTDIMQTEIVNDINTLFPIKWTRRAIWDKSYIEARIPKTPTSLIELLSHQNLGDMRYALCPDFRLIAARSMYKGIVKFLASQYGFDYVIQPLAVSQPVAQLIGNDSVRITWKKVIDPLEDTSQPDGYIVYTRKNDGGFCNGIISKDESLTIKIEKDIIYSFRIAAYNAGGESMPSEIVSAGIVSKEKGKAWIINAFDRIAAPAYFETDSTGGFLYQQDRGMPYFYDLGFTGNQIDYNKNTPFYDNDYPGFGASQANFEGQVIAGNTFDNIYIHGRAIMANGYSFSSGSKDGTLSLLPDLKSYQLLNVILGKQKTSNTHLRSYTLYPKELQTFIGNFSKLNGTIIVSGAYIGSDIQLTNDKATQLFTQNILKYKLRMPNASVSTNMVDVFSSKKRTKEYSCLTVPNKYQYAIQQVDAIQPADKNSSILLRYTENNTAAAIGYKGKYKTIICGFPFETISSPELQKKLMQLFIDF